MIASRMTPIHAVELVGAMMGGLVFLVLVVMLCRRCCRRCRRGRGHSYERVNHELDKEELDFKKALESQCSDLEASGESLFNDTELEQIEMIERFRDRLVAGDDDGETKNPLGEGPEAAPVKKDASKDD